MAGSQRILTLNLGTQTIGLAEFHVTDKGGLVLGRYVAGEVNADPALESTRIDQARLVIKELKDSLGVKKAHVNYAIPSQQVFTRFVKLPSVAAEKVDQIIQFEAQQNVPFPIDEVVWDYQLVSSESASQVEVALFAVKADLLDEINEAVEDSGMRAGVVDVAPMALYNSFRYNYSDVHGCSLLIDIGARTTNLVFVEGGRMFVRSVHVGGANSISTQIAKELGWSFQHAEDKKKADGFVGLGGAYADPPDPDVALMSKVIRQTMTRLHQQIVQSISVYKAQQGGKQPDRVYLCGGSVALPYMREFFAEKMNCHIEFFNPLRNVSVTNDVDIEEIVKNAHVLGELVGLALRGMSNCPVELNLRPASVVRAQEISGRTPFFAFTAICLALAVVLAWFYYMRASKVQEVAAEAVTAKVADMSSFEKKFVEMRKQKDELLERAKPLKQAVEAKNYWVRVLEEIHERLPADRTIWVTSFEPTTVAATAPATGPTAPGAKPTPKPPPVPPPAPGSKPAASVPMYNAVKIKGLFLWNEDTQKSDRIAREFAEAIMKDSSVFVSLPLPEIALNRTEQTDTAWAFSYEFTLRLKNPLPAQ